MAFVCPAGLFTDGRIPTALAMALPVAAPARHARERWRSATRQAIVHLGSEYSDEDWQERNEIRQLIDPPPIVQVRPPTSRRLLHRHVEVRDAEASTARPLAPLSSSTR